MEEKLHMSNSPENVMSLKDFIEKGTSPFHVVATAVEELRAAGFTELPLTAAWEIRKGGAYYVRIYDSSLVAFVVGDSYTAGSPRSLRIAASHTDFPNLRIKPKATMKSEGYMRLNIEVYGGLIRQTWLDRPLSIAGSVALKGADALLPEVRFVDFGRPVATIPSLAIHMNRKVNEGVEIKPQKELLPLVGLLSGEEEAAESDAEAFLETLAEELGVTPEDILSYELGLYVREGGESVGFANELFSSPRLDNLTSVQAELAAIIAAKSSMSKDRQGIAAAAFFDHEEVGSGTKQGAGSLAFRDVLLRIYQALGRTEEELFRDIAAGLMLSVDVAHGYHPAHDDKYDPTNHARLGDGVVIKSSARQSYASDALSIAMLKSIAESAGVPVRQAVNHADMSGGSTLGSIASTLLPMRTLDIGVPILAMHSARETMGAEDQASLCRLLTAFYQI
ncbi:M18 family aminopeptidase [Selenomonas sp. TAMA-11512]|uniref:M18 family aminopeptidase n=1 Tax=Selenomonas sp. TAMA-11512 TaxID=3095337 RepID=UPI0030866661|nr:M18 family aminopeptidase [Selenomonas sp. TAMA-11512]